MFNIPSNGKLSSVVDRIQTFQRDVIFVYMRNMLLCATLSFALLTAGASLSRPVGTEESFCYVAGN